MDSITVSYDRNKVLGVGISAQVYAGQFNGEEVAVKRILKRTDSDLDQDVQNREEQTMKNLNHENVLKLIDVQQDMDFKYLILELCIATVNDYIKGNYKEKMPTEIDALIQMGSGLAYIHSQCLVHRDIKPANVLISQSFVLKISDFGVCRPVSGSGSFSMTSGPKGTRIYYSPEFIELEGKTREDKEKIRANVTIDIFSLGCLYFSYLTKGCHPFAKDGGYPDEFVTISNIQSDTKVLDNGKLSPNHYAFAAIDGMTKRNPNERLKLVEVLKILILELCVATVDDYIRGNYLGQMPAEIDGLFQMASGLAYIHSKRFVHRDIKPANVLISPEFVLKISDFGFCKTVTNSGSFSTSSGLKGTPTYMAPEYLGMKGKSEDEIKVIRARLSLDTFSLGCVFFSYIKKDIGCHLFQNPKTKDFFSISSNIVKGKKFLEGEIPGDHYAYKLIDGMTHNNPEMRMGLDKVISTLQQLLPPQEQE